MDKKEIRPIKSKILKKKVYFDSELIIGNSKFQSNRSYEEMKVSLDKELKKLFTKAKNNKVSLDFPVIQQLDEIIHYVCDDTKCRSIMDYVEIECKKSVYTHSIDVCLTSIAIGKNYGMSKAELMGLGIGSLLHDVGKSQMMNLVEKKGPLSNDEWITMRKHPWIGYRILKNNGIENEISEMALEHHCPSYGPINQSNVKNLEDLNIYSRIVAVADVYSALTEDRPYRPAKDKKQILLVFKEMINNNLLCKEVIKYMA